MKPVSTKESPVFKHLRVPLLALVLLTSLFLSACSSDDATPAAATATPSTTATVAEATPTATETPTPTPTPEAAPVLPATVETLDGAVEVTDVSRVVVLNGDLTEVVYALGMGERVVGVDRSATYPPEAIAKASIGYQRDLSAEGIVSLEPTLIIGNEGAGPPPVIAQIRTLGIPVVILPSTTSLDGVTTKIQLVADALGVPERGRILAEETQAKIDEAIALAAGAKQQPKVAFLYLRGAQVQMLAGVGSRADAMIVAAGGLDAGTEAGVTDSMPITPESMVTADPDVILTTSSGLESVGGVDGVLGIPGIAQTTAGANRAVLGLDAQYFLGFGPRTGDALLDLVQALHPELQ